MRIAILGLGNVGGALAKVWSAAKHELYAGVRSPATTQAQIPGLKIESIPAVCQYADVIALSVPWNGVSTMLQQAGDLSGKILIDCTNPVKEDLNGLAIGTTTSAAEQVAALQPKAKVVKAFNTLGAVLLGNADFPDGRASGFYCGDDTEAKKALEPLISQAGLDPVDVGPLSNARWLEAMAMLWIDLALHRGFQANFAFRLVRK
jgi:predicted dinucleotide-binding enzyme